MFATNQQREQRFEQAERDEKKLSDEEATAKIDENFARQEQQIATMQKRLDVQKKYREEFAKVLTPQQVLRVLTPQRGQGNREQMQRRNGDGERRGGFEGGPRGGFGGGQRGGGFGGPGGGF
jgi:Spy/CpxP family protein refolding chaperone